LVILLSNSEVTRWNLASYVVGGKIFFVKEREERKKERRKE